MLMQTAPFMGGTLVTGQLRFTIVLACYMVLHPMLLAQISLWEGLSLASGLHVGVLIAKEVFLGMLMGFLVGMMFWTIQCAGFFIDNQRGRLKDIYELGRGVEMLKKHQFKLVIIDAFYRAMPMKMDENDNGGMAKLYNAIDRYAKELDCAFVLIHHTSKGNQSIKNVTDVGSGAGAQSRAADAHLRDVARRRRAGGFAAEDGAEILPDAGAAENALGFRAGRYDFCAPYV